MDLSHLDFAIVLVLCAVQIGAQLLCYNRLLAKKTAYKAMFLCWFGCLIVCAATQLWPGVGMTAPFAAVTGALWWRHRNDDDDDSGRRRRWVGSSLRSKLPRPVAFTRPNPTQP